MKKVAVAAVLAGLGLTVLTGCASQKPTITAAPPVSPMPAGAPPMAAPAGGVYDWRDVPVGERVPVTRAVFDQAGYQIYAAGGETIVVPFVNNNLYVMRFGRSENGGMYFLNDGSAPTLYLPHNGYLENAVAQGARWYPLPRDYAYTRPVYVSIAPSWNDYAAMGWYPGMHAYGGMWGYSPTASFVWMPGFYFNVGGSRYNDFVSYRTYYTNHRGYVPNRVVYRNYTPPRRTVTGFGSSSGSFSSNRSPGSFGSGRSSGSGSFGTGRRNSGFGGSSGSFGSSSGRSSVSGGTGSFGSGRSSVGGAGSSFGNSSSSGRSSFGSSSGSSTSSFGRSSGASSGTFGSRPGSSSGSSFGSGRSTSSSFGGSSGYSNSGRSSGSSFGGTRSFGSSSGSFGRSSGSSFGSGGSGSSSSSGGSSFGRSSSGSGSFGRSSSGGSFGRSSSSSSGRRR